MENKVKRIQKILKIKESILISDTFEVLSLINPKFSFNINEYDMNLLITKKNIYLICENLFIPFIKDRKDIKIIKAETFDYLKNNRLFIKEIDKILKKEKIVRIGFVDISLQKYFKNYLYFTFVSPIKTLSLIKSKKEIQNIKEIVKIMQYILNDIPNILKTNLSDIELRNIIDLNIYNYGGERRYVPTLIGFNPKTIYPTLKNDKLKKGDIVLIDFGIMKNNFGLSVSKTFIYGNISKQKEKIYSISMDGLDIMAMKIREGIKIEDIDREYRFFLKSHNLLNYSLEYTVKLPGTSYFEQINSINNKIKIYKNTLIKIVSSIFIPRKFGIRNENIILVNKTGGRILV